MFPIVSNVHFITLLITNIIIIFRYGTPDPDCLRECDMRLKLRMASVRYIHTQRFVSETLAFVQHFNQLQDVLGRSRAASAGQKVKG